MISDLPTEIDHIGSERNLGDRILGGEVVVVRKGLQQLDLYDTLADASLNGIRTFMGGDIAEKVKTVGFENIHEWVSPTDIPAVTDAVYEKMIPLAHGVLQKLVPRVFPDTKSFYFEKKPNVRFHIPYDLASIHKKQFSAFTQEHGEGKITAHGPHRDSWVDCPDNVVNVWIAIGPVKKGNGLTIFTKSYNENIKFTRGYIDASTKLDKPMSFNLSPGDAVLFHGSHLHGSELNRTNSTRFVISYRVSLDKPHYPYGHYHHYLHNKLVNSNWSWLAEIPANLQWSYISYRIRRVMHLLKVGKDPRATHKSLHDELQTKNHHNGHNNQTVALDDFPVNTIKAISDKVCVARLENDQFFAVSRRCPHMGGDVANGWISNGEIYCPLHNLAFNLKTGATTCQSLSLLDKFKIEVRDDHLHLI